MVYSTRRFVVCLSVCHFVLVFFSPFSIAVTSLGEERATLSAFRTLFQFVLVWICRLPLGIWEGLRFVIMALPGLFSYLFFFRSQITHSFVKCVCSISCFPHSLICRGTDISKYFSESLGVRDNESHRITLLYLFVFNEQRPSDVDDFYPSEGYSI